MAVIRPEIETDPAALEQIAIDYLQEAVEGWEPADGDLMTWLIGAHARMVAEERDIAADVPLEQILRPLGEQVHLVAPKLALPARVRATVTVRDKAGYTIRAGMEVLVRTAGDEGVTMVVTDDATLAPDTELTLPVQLEAAPGREGGAANGLDEDNEVVPLRPLEFIRSIRIDEHAVSSGGRDAESDEEYLARLVDTLALASPTPILPEDFAAIARQVDGVDRALALNLVLSRPEIVDLHLSEFSGFLTEGFTVIELAAPAAPPIAFREILRTALQEEGYDAEVELVGAAADRNYRLTLTGRPRYGPWRISGFDAPSSLTVVQQGGEANLVERAITIAVTDDAGGLPDDDVLENVQTTLESMREVNWMVSVIGPEPNPVYVDFRAVAWPDYDPEIVEPAAILALGEYLRPERWGRGAAGGTAGDATWIEEPVIRYLELAQVLNEVPGIHYVDELRLRLGSGGWVQSDVTMSGRTALPSPDDGEITGRVIGG